MSINREARIFVGEVSYEKHFYTRSSPNVELKLTDHSKGYEEYDLIDAISDFDGRKVRITVEVLE